MAIDSFLNAADSARVARTFLNLARHDISGWALTGGVAIELHILRLGGKAIVRRLNDLDFVAASFDSIPETIGSELLLRHIHPHDPPGKIMLLGVDPETGVRLDVFRAYGGEMERTSTIKIAKLALRTVSLQDLVARHARLNWPHSRTARDLMPSTYGVKLLKKAILKTGFQPSVTDSACSRQLVVKVLSCRSNRQRHKIGLR
jgi:hypothetical protein